MDGQYAYIGSANLTGAGMGMKSSNRRNFEAGIFTDDMTLIEAAMEQFDSVWRGEHCKKCGRKDFVSTRLYNNFYIEKYKFKRKSLKQLL